MDEKNDLINTRPPEPGIQEKTVKKAGKRDHAAKRQESKENQQIRREKKQREKAEAQEKAADQ